MIPPGDAGAALSPWFDSGRLVALMGEAGRGPDVLIVGGMHGNEPEGINAGMRVLDDLSQLSEALPGRVALIRGNLGALKAGKRFLDRDLNRRWRDEAIDRVRARRTYERSREDREQLDLIALFEAFAAEAGQGVVLVDLHTTSAGAPPFSVVLDSEFNRALALACGLPVILGFERFVDAPILSWFASRGWSGVGVEGGGGGDASSEAHLADALRGVLSFLGWPIEREEEQRRQSVSYQIVHRHSVVPGSAFRMLPGFQSFQPVKAGELLAHDRTGEIRAMQGGWIFMPLYQSQGSDGFFLLRQAP